MTNTSFPAKEQYDLFKILRTRFEKNIDRHQGLEWTKVEIKLKANLQKLQSLYNMEKTGGEPDIIEYDKKTDEYVFYDCSPESPKDRRNLCYDLEAWQERKTFKPKSNALDMATHIGIEILTEDQYRKLQSVGSFDTKTSSWIKTPIEIRKLGGALFADRRYNSVFVYHNSAPSYYASRGFRGFLKI